MAFTETVHAGCCIKCTPFFRYEGQARDVAERFAFTGKPGVVRAVLTLLPPPKKGRGRK